MKQIYVTPDGIVRLHLPKAKEYKPNRTIGHIKDDTYTVEKSDNCIMRVFGGSIGFNYELMHDYRFTTVVVCLPSGRKLRTQRQTVLDYGHFLHFKENLLERQIFLSLSDFDKPSKNDRRAHKNERPPSVEEDLFGQISDEEAH